MSLIPHSLRRVLVSGAAVLVLGGAAVSIAAAQAAPATTPSGQQSGYQKFVDALAKRLNISSAALETAIGQARSDAGMPGTGQGFPGRPGPGGPGGPGGPRGGFGIDFNTAATFLGVTPQQLRTELPGKSLAQLATAANKNPNDLDTALKNAANAQITAAVTAGKLTADQGTARTTAVDARIDTLINQVMPAAGQGGGPGGPGGRRGPGGGLFGIDFNTAATFLGVTPQQLRTELPGKSLAQLATAANKNPNDLDTALKNAANAQITAAVTAGKLTADQGTARTTAVDSRIDTLINQVIPQRGTQGAGGAGA